MPLDATLFPERGEPLGGVTALLTALYEPRIRAVYVHGILVSYTALLNESFVYQPADSIIRGLLRMADLPDIAVALSPRPLWMEGLVDGCNRHVSRMQAEEAYHLARAAYARSEKPNQLSIEVEKASADKISQWFISCF